VKFSDLELSILVDSHFRLDGGAMFGVVPKVLWSRKAPADERNRITLAANCLLIRAAGKTLVVETGMGGKADEKFNDIYAVERPKSLVQALAGQGVKPEDVDIVINTHLHFDHCGGNTERGPDGEPVSTFPNAEYVVQKGEYEHAVSPTDRDRVSYMPENYEPLAKTGQLKLVEGDTEIVPGVEVVHVPGHTEHQQCVRLRSGGQIAFFFADLVPTAAHLPFAWIMGFDLFPLTTLEEKKRWIPRAVEERWLCLFAHDTEVPAAHLAEKDGKVVAEPVTDSDLVIT
jgi:glyoxylase-like metal-dependent hydrolase (beta-lactamase superfamily II)